MSVIGLPCIVCGTFVAVMNADAYERATLDELVYVCADCEVRIEADDEQSVLLADELAIRQAVEQERDRVRAATEKYRFAVTVGCTNFYELELELSHAPTYEEVESLALERVKQEHGIYQEMEVVEFSPMCRVCGCSQFEPCEGGCEWVEADLCSACAEAKQE